MTTGAREPESHRCRYEVDDVDWRRRGAAVPQSAPAVASSAAAVSAPDVRLDTHVSGEMSGPGNGIVSKGAAATSTSPPPPPPNGPGSRLLAEDATTRTDTPLAAAPNCAATVARTEAFVRSVARAPRRDSVGRKAARLAPPTPARSGAIEVLVGSCAGAPAVTRTPPQSDAAGTIAAAAAPTSPQTAVASGESGSCSA